jgi:hypothetical protein
MGTLTVYTRHTHTHTHKRSKGSQTFRMLNKFFLNLFVFHFERTHHIKIPVGHPWGHQSRERAAYRFKFLFPLIVILRNEIYIFITFSTPSLEPSFFLFFSFGTYLRIENISQLSLLPFEFMKPFFLRQIYIFIMCCQSPLRFYHKKCWFFLFFFIKNIFPYKCYKWIFLKSNGRKLYEKFSHSWRRENDNYSVWYFTYILHNILCIDHVRSLSYCCLWIRLTAALCTCFVCHLTWNFLFFIF